jgi:hypothetical protein
MAVENPNWLSIILPALIGALSGSFGGNFVSDWLKKRAEKDKLRKDLTDKYLIQLQYIIQSFSSRLYNMKNRGGAQYMTYIKGNDEYYTVSTLYALGTLLAYHRMLLLEGIYAQIEYIYPDFGSLLIKKFDEFGTGLDEMRIKNPETFRSVKFFRYDRMALGDAITEKENNVPRLVSYLKFRNMYGTDDSIKSALEPASQFVQNLAYAPASDLENLVNGLDFIQKELEQRTQIQISS